MINSDVQLFWAKDENGNIAIIYDLNDADRDKKYICPVCGSEVRPVAIGGKTKDGKVAQVSSHFSHFDASKCNAETAIHWWFKNKILINGDSFRIKTDTISEYKCKDVFIEQSYETEFGEYTPDITIVTECGKTIYFEMNYSNKKNVKDFIDKWLVLGNIVVEVDLKTLMSAALSSDICEFNALFYEGKCFNQKSDLYYETIGKHKENILKDKVLDDSIKERIKKLDWFWMEVVKYSKEKINLDEFVDLVDYNDKEDNEIIFDILLRNKCKPIYEDYVNYKVNEFNKIAINFFDSYNDMKYKNMFKILLYKEGRKNKNIEYNSIHIYCSLENMKDFLSFNFDICAYSFNSFNDSLKQIINKYEAIIKCKELSELVYNKIKTKYTVLSKRLDIDLLSFFSEYKNGYKEKGIAKIKICTKFKHMYSSIKNINVRFYIDCIKIGTFIQCLDNVDNIVDWISSYIDDVITEYKIKLVQERKYIQEQIKIRTSYRKNIVNLYEKCVIKIVNIFNLNKDIIYEYNTNYSYNGYDNLIYFKDNNNREYVICSTYLFVHNKHNKKNEKINIVLPSNIELITLCYDDLASNKLYMYKNQEGYEIKSQWGHSEITYKFNTYFNNKHIKFSFYKHYTMEYLERYNYVNVTKNLVRIYNQIKTLKEQKLCEIYDNNGILESKYIISDKNINKEIDRLLYPISYIVDKKNCNKINIRLNIDFTLKDGKRQPWLIKGFIEALNSIGIENVENIIK